MRVAFGQWLPDLPDLQNPGALEAINVIPDVNSYRSMRGLQSFTSALDGPALVSFWSRDTTGDIFNFAGDSTKLYHLTSSTTWTNVSQGGNYTTLSWDMVNFGRRVLAATPSTTVQYYDMGVSNLFADLPNAPSAEYVAIVRDFVVLGLVDADPFKVQWSGLNNSEQWTASGATQSGSQTLSGRGGPIRRVIGGDRGYIFQERTITAMTYVGPPVIFRFDEIESARGTPAPFSVVQLGSKIYYYAIDGFFVLDTLRGNDSVPIGTDRVNQWFRDEVDSGAVLNMRGSLDRTNSLIIWSFKTSSSLAHSDRLLMYNWQSDRWSTANVDTEIIAEYAAESLSLDQLDSVLPGGIDATPFSVDDEAFAGGAVTLIAFNTDHETATFSGDTLPYTLDTGEISDDDNLLFVNNIRPLIELSSGSDFCITPITRNNLYGNPILGAAVAPNNIGSCDVRVNARYHRYRLTGTSIMTHGIGVEFTPKRKGKR